MGCVFKSEGDDGSWSDWFDDSAGLIHSKITLLNDKSIYASTTSELYFSRDAGEKSGRIQI